MFDISFFRTKAENIYATHIFRDFYIEKVDSGNRSPLFTILGHSANRIACQDSLEYASLLIYTLYQFQDSSSHFAESSPASISSPHLEIRSAYCFPNFFSIRSYASPRFGGLDVVL